MVASVRSAGSISLAASILLPLAACGSPPASAVPASPPVAVIARADEVHLTDVRQLEGQP